MGLSMSCPRGLGAKLASHLNKFGVETCPLCKQADWKANAHGYAHVQLSMSPTDPYENDAPVPMSFPCAALVCEQCGYVAFVNLHVAGIVEQQATAVLSPADVPGLLAQLEAAEALAALPAPTVDEAPASATPQPTA